MSSDSEAMPNARPEIESIVTSVHETETGESFLGVSVFWTDQCVTYGFCEPSDVDTFLWEMVACREANNYDRKEVTFNAEEIHKATIVQKPQA